MATWPTVPEDEIEAAISDVMTSGEIIKIVTQREAEAKYDQSGGSVALCAFGPLPGRIPGMLNLYKESILEKVNTATDLSKLVGLDKSRPAVRWLRERCCNWTRTITQAYSKSTCNT